MLPADIDSRFVRSLVRSSAIVLLAACAPDPVAPTRAPDFAPVFAKAAPSGGPAVNSTLPTSGDKGQTLDVHVFGSGFANGASAQWALHGVVDPSKVRTNSTTVVSSTELVANITISSDAAIAYWDVQVALGGKTGVGTELFEVTTAVPVLSVGGNSGAVGVNDRGDIAGSFSAPSNEPHAFVVSGNDGALSDLGLQQARAISADGLTAVGGIGPNGGQPIAGVWTRPAGAAWPSAGTRLPDALGMTSTQGRANGITAIVAEGVTVIAGNLTGPWGPPVYWQSADGTWSAPAQRLPLPPGVSLAGAEAIAATTGDIVGEVRDASGTWPAVWRRVSGSYVLEVLPRPSGYSEAYVRAISPTGTVMVGNVRQSAKGREVIAPATWARNATTGAYTVTLLPTLSGTYSNDGKAFGVTVVGTQVRAVGTSPPSTTGTFLHPVLWTWTVGATDYQVRDIGGLGRKTDVAANGINPSGTIVVGTEGTSTAIKWILQ